MPLTTPQREALSCRSRMISKTNRYSSRYQIQEWESNPRTKMTSLKFSKLQGRLAWVSSSQKKLFLNIEVRSPLNQNISRDQASPSLLTQKTMKRLQLSKVLRIHRQISCVTLSILIRLNLGFYHTTKLTQAQKLISMRHKWILKYLRKSLQLIAITQIRKSRKAQLQLTQPQTVPKKENRRP